jgi:hypothetical protein
MDAWVNCREARWSSNSKLALAMHFICAFKMASALRRAAWFVLEYARCGTGNGLVWLMQSKKQEAVGLDSAKNYMRVLGI